MNQIIVKKFVIIFSHSNAAIRKISLNRSVIDQTTTPIVCAVSAIEKYQGKRGEIKLCSL